MKTTKPKDSALVPNKPVKTAGGEIESGSLIELVSSGDRELGLHLFDDKKMFVLDQSHPLGRAYQAITLPDSLRRAIYLPSSAAESSRDEELVPTIMRHDSRSRGPAHL